MVLAAVSVVLLIVPARRQFAAPGQAAAWSPAVGVAASIALVLALLTAGLLLARR